MTQLLSDFAFSKSETDKNLKLQGHFNQKHENLSLDRKKWSTVPIYCLSNPIFWKHAKKMTVEYRELAHGSGDRFKLVLWALKLFRIFAVTLRQMIFL